MNDGDLSEKEEVSNFSLTLTFLAIVAMIGAGGYMVYWSDIAPCKPCGYINYENKVEDGFEAQIMGLCYPCSRASDPDSYFRGVSHKRALAGCPPIYTQEYNKRAAELNAQLQRKGFKPEFEIIDEKR
jgi:hypothetical protein